MSNVRIGHRAALTAVIVAFIAGLAGSLAIRPPGGVEHGAAAIASGRTQRIHWRMPVAFQTTMPTIGDNPVYVTDMIYAVSGDGVRLEIFEPGEVVPAFSILDAVRDGKVEAGYTWLGYDQGKIPASVLLGAVPFGMEPWEFSAWWFEAGGRELGEALYEKYNAYPLFCGLTGPETAGWFRSRIDSLDDIRGLKIRFAGLGGKVIERLGASVTMLPGGEIFQALEKGAIDATEWVAPYNDLAFGFHKVAKFYYAPGVHEPGPALGLTINTKAFEELPADLQAIVKRAAGDEALRMLCEMTVGNAEALGVLLGKYNVQLRRFPREVYGAMLTAGADVAREAAEKDPFTRKVYESWQGFRKKIIELSPLTELGYMALRDAQRLV